MIKQSNNNGRAQCTNCQTRENDMPDEDGIRTEDEWVAVKALFTEHVIRSFVSSGKGTDDLQEMACDFLDAMPEYPHISWDFESGWFVALEDGLLAIRKSISQIPPLDLFDGKPIEKIHLLAKEMMGGYWHKTQINSALIWYAKKYGLVFSAQERRHFVKEITETMNMIKDVAEGIDPKFLTFNVAGPATPEVELDDNGEGFDNDE